MQDAFTLKLILAFLVGSIWITAATMLSERLGTKIGGIVGGLPSTIVIALFFIGWTQSPQAVVQATTLVPMTIGAVAIFTVLFVLLAKKNFFLALFGSLSAWAVLVLLGILLKPNFIFSIVVYCILFAFSYYILEIRSDIQSVSKQPMRYTLPVLAFRGIVSGAIVAGAVWIAKITGPLVGGVFGTFPAVFLSTAVITYLTHGSGFSGAVMKSLLLTGCFTVLTYALGVRYLIIPLGLGWGSLASYGLSLLTAMGVLWFVQKKMK